MTYEYHLVDGSFRVKLDEREAKGAVGVAAQPAVDNLAAWHEQACKGHLLHLCNEIEAPDAAF